MPYERHYNPLLTIKYKLYKKAEFLENSPLNKWNWTWCGLNIYKPRIIMAWVQYLIILHTWIFKIAQIFSIVFNFGICYIRWLFERIDQTPGFWTLSFVVRFFGLILFTLLNDIKIFSCSQDFIHICMKKSWNLIRFNTVTTFPVIIWKKVIKL